MHPCKAPNPQMRRMTRRRWPCCWRVGTPPFQHRGSHQSTRSEWVGSDTRCVPTPQRTPRTSPRCRSTPHHRQAPRDPQPVNCDRVGSMSVSPGLELETLERLRKCRVFDLKGIAGASNRDSDRSHTAGNGLRPRAQLHGDESCGPLRRRSVDTVCGTLGHTSEIDCHKSRSSVVGLVRQRTEHVWIYPHHTPNDVRR